MKTTLALTIAAVLAAVAGTASAVTSGDTCSYTPSSTGTQYTVNIVTGGGIAQYGYAFTTPGLTLSNISISGRNGNYTTQNLPSGTNGAWLSDEQLTGNVNASLQVAGKLSGGITIVPSGTRYTPTPTPTSGGAAQDGTVQWYDAVACTLRAASGQTLSFAMGRPTWSTSSRGWHLGVKVGMAGKVSAKQIILQSENQISHPSVIVKQRAIKSGGTVMLTLKPTDKGLRGLTLHHFLKVKLLVTFDAADGREAHKTISLTLRK